MHVSHVEFGATPPRTAAEPDPVRRFAELLPRPLRFLGVGGLGLITDLAIFTLVLAHHPHPHPHPLLARLVSLAVATFVTWRLNRALTFDRSGRHPAHEALRYAVVACSAQAISYAIFAALVLTVLAPLPQLAVLIGAATAALVSYGGQSLFAFRPHRAAADPQRPA